MNSHISASTSGPVNSKTWIALLGRKDTPTDGVEDYCVYLGRTLAETGIALERERVPWDERGWIGALREMRRRSAAWRGEWVLLQYTAMSWSRRGFPLFALAALGVLRRGGARIAVVFHESSRQGNSWPRWIDRLRAACQDWVIARLYTGATRAIFADPLDTISWLPKDRTKAAFIPIGANIPPPEPRADAYLGKDGAPKTVVVFCLSEPPNRNRELSDIAHAIRSAAVTGPKLRLVLLGRGTSEAQPEIDRAFGDIPVEISNLGIRTADEVSRTLAGSDVMLCVRGRLFPRRASAIAGIACGLPLVGYAGAAEGTPLEEAGLKLVPYGDPEALGLALTHVLADENLRRNLREKSLFAQRNCFSWEKIAATFVRVLGARQV